MSQDSYVLDRIHASPSRLYAAGQCVNLSQERCPNCGVFLGAPEDMEVALTHTGSRGFTEQLGNLQPIFQEDLIELWQRQGMTGFKVTPIRVVGWHEQPQKPLPKIMPHYNHLIVTSYVRLLVPPPKGKPCPLCGFVEYKFPKTSNHLPRGIVIDPASWDSTDFFGLKYYGLLFCSRRLAEITLVAGYHQNMAFVRVEDWCRWDDFSTKKWDPKAYQKYLEEFLIRKPEKL